jgi:hypothetical protein
MLCCHPPLQVTAVKNETTDVASNDVHHASYTQDVYKLRARPLLDYNAKWLQALGSPIVQLDAGFKLHSGGGVKPCMHSGGVLAVLSGMGYVLGVYIGTASLWCIVAYLAARGRHGNAPAHEVHRQGLFMGDSVTVLSPEDVRTLLAALKAARGSRMNKQEVAQRLLPSLCTCPACLC